MRSRPLNKRKEINIFHGQEYTFLGLPRFIDLKFGFHIRNKNGKLVTGKFDTLSELENYLKRNRYIVAKNP